jgi:adenylate kinase family enzyme
MTPTEARRVVILGNSGAGKSTLAARLARQHQLAHLDLDTLAWLPAASAGAPPERAPLADSIAQLERFICANERWVIEGCYADLLTAAAARSTLLVFINPGTLVCLAHCRARPWEPHKYASKRAQDANLEMLLDWVRDYETREDEFSLSSHRALFDGFSGNKRELAAGDEL